MADPRIDPVPGDSIAREFATARGGCIIREVTRAHGGFVFYLRDNGYTSRREIVSLDRWRKWAAKADLLEVAKESAVSQEIKHEGLHARRLAPEQNNPREVAFAEQWREENTAEYRRHVLANLLVRPIGGDIFFCERVEQLAPYDQQSASVAATVIQWLGSNVGFCFLEQALKRCGYQIVEDRRERRK